MVETKHESERLTARSYRLKPSIDATRQRLLGNLRNRQNAGSADVLVRNSERSSLRASSVPG